MSLALAAAGIKFGGALAGSIGAQKGADKQRKEGKKFLNRSIDQIKQQEANAIEALTKNYLAGLQDMSLAYTGSLSELNRTKRMAEQGVNAQGAMNVASPGSSATKQAKIELEADYLNAGADMATNNDKNVRRASEMNSVQASNIMTEATNKEIEARQGYINNLTQSRSNIMESNVNLLKSSASLGTQMAGLPGREPGKTSPFQNSFDMKYLQMQDSMKFQENGGYFFNNAGYRGTQDFSKYYRV